MIELPGCVTTGTESSWATFSQDGTRRYLLGRQWSPQAHIHRTIVFLMLNPSTADALVPDPTITKCIGFAERMGGVGILVANLFAVRTPYPKELAKMAKASDKSEHGLLDVKNTRALTAALQNEGRPGSFIAAWGRFPSKGVSYFAEFPIAHIQRTATLAGVTLQCLGRTKDGQPRHPLMLSYRTQPEPFEGRAA